MTFQTVRVDLGARAYDIVVGSGAFHSHTDRLSDIAGGGQVAIITDDTVFSHYEALMTEHLGNAPIIRIAPGEQSKSYQNYVEVMEKLIAASIGRDGVILAIGGGVVGDLAGFAAATLRRGCRFVQVPTTLLAQVDSSVGGKTAINSPQGKNLIGTFYQPALVLADTTLLNTLPDRQMRAGYAEVVKYGLINDPDFFAWLEDHGAAVLARDEDALSYAVATCCRAKAEIVKNDETERGQRALLNLGHTFGHALESAMGYDGRLLHGEAIAVGMAMAYRYSAAHGLCKPADCDRVEAHLQACGLPAFPSDIPGLKTSTDKLMTFVGQDKKVEGGRLTFIFTRGIGSAYVASDVAPRDIRDFFDKELEQ
ncbi:MAG: 3-dehydroquinate synthase [Parvularcula sp.]